MRFDKNNLNPKILCVDDEINLEVLDEALDDIFNIQMVESAEACIEFVNVCKPHLILLDINMHGMSGLEACKILKSNTSSSEIPIIFISALGREEEKEHGFQAGGDAYLSKPFNEDELLDTIHRFL